jgi:hypothetical protein
LNAGLALVPDLPALKPSFARSSSKDVAIFLQYNPLPAQNFIEDKNFRP